jgi:YVTN family beta-propeller protein
VYERRLRRRKFSFATLAVVLLTPALAMFLSATTASAAPQGFASGTVYVTNLNLNTVTAINASNSSFHVLKASSPSLNGPLGIAIAPDGNRAYVTNSDGNTVRPIDLQTTPPTFETPIVVGSGPAAIAITPDGATAYVTNFNSNTVTPIHLGGSHPSPGAPIPVGSGPWSIAVSPDGKYVCVSNSEAQSVSVIDTATRHVTTIQVTSAPQAIAIAPDGLTAYVANGSVVSPIDLATSPPSLKAPITVANGPLGIAITSDGTTAFTANTDNTVTPINLTTSPASPGAVVSVGSLSQPDGIAIAPDGETAYVANATNTVTPINLSSTPPTPEKPVAVGAPSFGIAIAPGQAPTAHLSVTSAPAGKPTYFDATGSTLSGGTITNYNWNFGDGTVAATSTPRTSHIYTHAGSYTPSVTETGSDGTSTTRTFTGQTVSNNGGGSARASAQLHVSSALQTSPASGPPGIAVTLADSTFTSACRPLYVFFDNKLIDQVAKTGTAFSVHHLVVPGDATVGSHHLEVSCTTARPWLLSVPFRVTVTVNHLSEFSVAMPSPTQLQDHLVSSGGISIAVLLVSRLIGAGFPSEWLDSTYAENRERIQARARKRFPRLFINREAEKSTLRRTVIGSILFLGFILFAGLINSFLDKGFGLNRTTLWLFLGQCLGVAIVTLTSQLPILFGGLRERRKIHMHVLVGGMIIAIICVSASRALGLSPGYCYGLIAVFVLRPHTDEKDWGRLHAIASVCVLVVSSAAFFLTVPVFHAATSHSPSPFWLILDPALNVTFLGGFASLAFGMFPLPFLPGRHVREWNRVAWMVITTIGLVGFVAVLLSPGSGSPSELHHIALLPLIAAFAAFAIGSLGFMLYFHLRPNPPTPSTPHPTGASAD